MQRYTLEGKRYQLDPMRLLTCILEVQISISIGLYLRASRAPQMQLILTAADRARLGFRTGLYEICIFGLQDSTVGLTPREENTGGRYTASDSVVYTLPVYSRRTQSYFVYSPPQSSQKSNMTLRVEGLNANLTSGQAPPRVFYRLCESD